MKFKLLLLFIILPFILHSQWTVEKDKDAWGDTVGKTFISSKINSGGVISWKNRPRNVNVGLGSYNYEVKILSNKIIIWSTDMPSWNRKEKADSKYIKIKFDNQPEIKILANRVQGSQVDIYSNLSTLKKI